MRLLFTMSIAISAKVSPSRRMNHLFHAMCLGAVAAGCAAGVGLVGHISLPFGILIVGASVICVWFALLQYHRQQKSYRVSISGDGTIRLAQQEGVLCALAEDGEAVRLLEGSTLWSGMMLLRLQSQGGKVFVLRILPDTVLQQEFRALSVAFRWIAARADEHRGEVLTDRD